jgi:hypothetical protein
VLPSPTSFADWGTRGVGEEAADWGEEEEEEEEGERGGREEAADLGEGERGGREEAADWELGFHPVFIRSQKEATQ